MALGKHRVAINVCRLLRFPDIITHKGVSYYSLVLEKPINLGLRLELKEDKFDF